MIARPLDLEMPVISMPQDPSLRVAFCLPVLRQASSSDSSFLLQKLIAQRLVQKGHRINFVIPADLEKVIFTDDLDKISTVPQTWSKAGCFRLTRRMSWKIQQLLHIPYLNYFSNYSFYDAYCQCLPGHDIVHERNGVFRMAVAMACRRLNLPYIHFFDGDDVLEHAYGGRSLTGILRRRAERMIRYNLSAADRIICVSTTGKRHLENVWQVPGEKIVVLPNGVDVDLYRPKPENITADRAGLGIDQHPLIVFVSSFYPWHDVALLLRAFSTILGMEPEARLLMIGDGERCAEAKQLAGELNLNNTVRFTGFLPQAEVSRLVNASDIAVAPYKKMAPELFIGSPMKLFEYMAAGKAVVATGIGQICEVIQNRVNGLLVEAGNPQAFANALQALIQAPQLRIQLSRQARIDAVQKFSWEQYTARLSGLYTAVIAEKRAARKAKREGK